MLGSKIQDAYPVHPTQQLYNGFTANNKYQHFPPLMSDGRAVVGGYTPEAVVNQQIIQNYGIENNWQYRQFMTTNAKRIGEENFVLAANDIGYTSRSIDIVK
jgi:hypothetical protein